MPFNVGMSLIGKASPTASEKDRPCGPASGVIFFISEQTRKCL